MVRATAASLAATSNPADTSPTPASRVAELGEHIDATLRIHEPAEDVAVVKGEPIEHQVDFSIAERLTIPFADPTIKGFVFVRKHASDAPLNPTTYEAAIFFNGNCVSSIDGCPTRREAITVVEKDLYRHIYLTKAFAAEARELNAIIHALVTLGPDEHIPAGESCEWPLTVDDEEPPVDSTTDDSDINEDGDVECAVEATSSEALVKELQEWPGDMPESVERMGTASVQLPPADAGGACGEGGVVAAAESIESAEQFDARQTMMRLEDDARYAKRLTFATEDYVKSSLHRLELEKQLKRAKKKEQAALDDLDDLRESGPDYRVAMPLGTKSTPSTSTTTAPTFPSHDPLPPPAAEHTPTSPQAGEPEANHAAATAAARDWQSASIDELGLPPSLTEKLRENGCPTIGKLEALRGSFDGLKSIRGIGKAKIDTIEDAVLAWLSKNRDSAALTAAKESAIAGEAVGLEMAAQAQ